MGLKETSNKYKGKDYLISTSRCLCPCPQQSRIEALYWWPADGVPYLLTYGFQLPMTLNCIKQTFLDGLLVKLTSQQS